jgi:probable F420-dependent oxidoreductase
MTDIEFSVQGRLRDRDSWVALARRVEADGYRTLYVADHPGYGSSPWVALAAAAAVTETLRLGTYVVQGGVREPAQVAADAVALSVLAPGRVTLGLGAGHNPAEWHQIGRERPSPADRAGRLVEFLEVAARLLQGETVSFDGRYLSLRDAGIAGADGSIRLLVGGGNPVLLRAAARRADVVALSGLGRTRADGRDHDVRWSRQDLERQLGIVRAEAAEHGREPVLDALVQMVRVTGDRHAALAELAAELEAPVEDLATAPFLLIGTHEQMAAQLRRQADQFGITSYVVRESGLDDVSRVRALLGS